MPIVYARASTENGQATAPEIAAFKTAGVERLDEEHASAGRWERPKLRRVLDPLRIGNTARQQPNTSPGRPPLLCPTLAA